MQKMHTVHTTFLFSTLLSLVSLLSLLLFLVVLLPPTGAIQVKQALGGKLGDLFRINDCRACLDHTSDSGWCSDGDVTTVLGLERGEGTLNISTGVTQEDLNAGRYTLVYNGEFCWPATFMQLGKSVFTLPANLTDPGVRYTSDGASAKANCGSLALHTKYCTSALNDTGMLIMLCISALLSVCLICICLRHWHERKNRDAKEQEKEEREAHEKNFMEEEEAQRRAQNEIRRQENLARLKGEHKALEMQEVNYKDATF